MEKGRILMNDLYLISIIIAILYIWFDTDAFVEWSKLFRLKIFKYKEFEDERNKKISSLTYHDYLLLKHNNFFTRLVTCPYCFGAWINIILLLIFSSYVGGFYLIGLNMILSWVGYSWVRRFLKD